jgi:hypothetical protein
MSFFVLILAIFLYYSYRIVKFLNHILYVKLAYLKKRDDYLDEKYKPFERYDFNDWNYFEIYFCAIFCLPLRIFFIIIFTISYYLSVLFITFGLAEE